MKEERKKSGGKIRALIYCCAAFFSLFFMTDTVSAEEQTIYNSPYVSVTEDGKAWTTNPGDQNIRWYAAGERVETGISSSLRELNRGEHYYMTRRQGMVPIGWWKVQWKQGQCIHNSYPAGENAYHGIPFGRQVCQRLHYSGWVPYCADCGESITDRFVYMSREAAATIDYIKLGEGMAYYYLCPFCSNLEQAAEFGTHFCKAVSCNQYRVRYDANCVDYDGYMGSSIHMYQNAEVYEGKTVTPITHLSINGYLRTGYVFDSWNTAPDGTGERFADGEEILNLTDQDYHINEEEGTIVLYAQWTAVNGTLCIDPNGGRYNGCSDISSITQEYGTVYRVESALISPPEGHRVTFVCNGGSKVPDVTGTMHFAEWKLEQPFHGSFQNDIYCFDSPEGEEDVLTASYGYDSVILPSTEKPGSSFGGWYYDAEFQLPAGAAGDSITPAADLTLYAQWVELTLYGKDNYRVNGGKGAVDLSWSQADGKDKWYLLFQSTDGENWNRIVSAEDIGKERKTEISDSYTGGSQTITIEATGLYTLTAAGAQGGGYGGWSGGKGGSVTASFWLKQGEVLTYTVGGANGYHGGGKGDMYGNGGGCTVVSSDQKGVLLVAGGGGGATIAGAGGAGGSEAGVLSAGYTGESGGAGGGGGYRGGAAGERILHHHTESCYRDSSYNGLEGAVLFQEYDRHAEVEHDWEENECGDCYQYSLQRAGSRAQPIPVRGNQEVQVQAMLWKQICRGGELWEDSCLRVYDQDGRCFFSQDLSNIMHNSSQLRHQMIDRQIEAWGRDKTNVLFPRFQTEFIWQLPEKNEEDEDNGGYTKYWSVRNSNGTSEIMGEYKASEADPVTVLWGKTIRGAYPLFPDFNFRNTGDSGYHLENTPLFFVRNNGCNESGVLLNYTVQLPADATGIYVEAFAKGDPAYSHDLVKTLITEVTLQGGKEVICGMAEGQIVSSKPSCGGSSYVNTEYAYTYSQQPGRKEGDGSFFLQAVSVGYVEEHSLEGVWAPDLEAPEAVAEEQIRKEGLGSGRILVTWEKPEDYGTVYYHAAESYFAGSSTALCRSNETVNTLTSGVKGYFYCVDENSDTKVTDGSEYTSRQSLTVKADEKLCYLHLAAVDAAGNVSGTVHIPLHADAAARPLHTEPLSVTAEAGNIYPAGERKWYVRSDGATPFALQYSSYIDGKATERYQINYADFVSAETQGEPLSCNRLYLQSQALSSGPIPVPEEQINFSAENTPLLTCYPYIEAYRDDGNRSLSVLQKFTLDQTASGKQIELYPRAGAEWEGEIFYSAKEEDVLHGLTLIGDGEPPVIRGMEILRTLSLIDRRTVHPVLNLTAEDALSGVGEFYLTVYNTDNNCEKQFFPDEAGCIQVELTDDDPLFSGDFTAIAYAADHVGNETRLSEETTEFGLTAQIERILSPHDPVFQNGESGILRITAWGYPDYIEIEFPQEMTDQNAELNKRFEYIDSPLYCQEEQLQFMIPLYTPANADYTVTVRAYKGEKQLEQYPELSVVEVSGTVLDDFRTRLR